MRFDWRVHADRKLLRAAHPAPAPRAALEPQLGDRPRDGRARAVRPAPEGGRLSATPATKALQRAGVPFAVHTYKHDPKHESYGLEAAERLSLDPATVFKTLVAQVDGKLVVAIVPVERQLDLKALAAAIKAKKARWRRSPTPSARRATWPAASARSGRRSSSRP